MLVIIWAIVLCLIYNYPHCPRTECPWLSAPSYIKQGMSTFAITNISHIWQFKNTQKPDALAV